MARITAILLLLEFVSETFGRVIMIQTLNAMTEPTPYSPTDFAEVQSKKVLENLLDGRYVKSDIRTRDKYPNVDGTVELVNDKNVPTGKFDVQLRSMPKGQTSFSCETSLVSYSQVSTLPVLLICVDSENERAYWKHINPHMPEFKDKANQKTFTVHFLNESDSIDQRGIYRRRWMEIAADYQKCIEQYPVVSAGDARKLGLETIEPSERELFQRFIDTINNLLDNDFVVFKEIVFPGVWKLGVGIVSSDQYHIQYQIYSIPYREPSPLVCKLSQGSLFTSKRSKNAITETVSSKESLIDPVKAGKEFVVERVLAVLKSKLLPIYGHYLSSDILCSFVDLYSPALGIQPGLSRYAVRDLSTALNQHLIRMAIAVRAKGIALRRSHYEVDLDVLCHYLRQNRLDAINADYATVSFAIGTDIFPIRSVFDSLKYLVANGVTDIERSFGTRDAPFAQGRNWIWSGYSPQTEAKSITHILNHSISEYAAFVNGNRLRFPKSPYLDPDVAVVYEYEPSDTHDYGPGLLEYFIRNERRTLPKLSVFVKDQEHNHVDKSRFPMILIDGNTYDSPSCSSMLADFFFQINPFLNFIYVMLSRDLSEHYGITHISY